MPELPEVEVVVRQIKPVLLHQVIHHSTIFFKQLRYPIEIAQCPCYINAIFRRSKYIILELQPLAHPEATAQLIAESATTSTSTSIFKATPAIYAIWHLGMTGQFKYLPSWAPLLKHDHVEFELEQGYLRYNDPRRFGCLLISTDYQKHPLIAHLGLEPLAHPASTLAQAWLTAAQLKRNASRHKGAHKAVKPFIMNNQHVVGIGNIYASEILSASHIHPDASIDTLTLANWLVVAQYTQSILQAAIEQGGSTLRDFVDVAGNKGYFQQQHVVYNRAGQGCYACGTLIEKKLHAGRSSFFCPQCQAT